MPPSQFSPNDWSVFGGRVAYLAKRAGLSVPAFSKACGLSEAGLSMLAEKLKGGRLAGEEVSFKKILAYSGCDAGWLMLNFGQPFPGEQVDPMEAALEDHPELPPEFAAAFRRWQETNKKEAPVENWVHTIGVITEALSRIEEPRGKRTPTRLVRDAWTPERAGDSEIPPARADSGATRTMRRPAKASAR